jgi:hypothetical protein
MKKSLPFVSAALAALVLILAAGCGNNGDPSSPPPPTASPPVALTEPLAVTAGDDAFKLVATGGGLKSALKVYIKTDGTEVLITTATPAPADFTDLTANADVVGNIIVVRGLSAAQSTGNNDGTLDSDNPVPVTLAALAQSSKVNSITVLSKVQIPFDTYTVAASAVNTAANIFYDGGTGDLSIGNNGSTIDVYTVDEHIDPEVHASLSLFTDLQATDTITFASGVLPEIGLTVAPTTIAAFNNILEIGDVTLAQAFTIDATEELTIPANRTLTLDSGSIVLTAADGSPNLPGKVIFKGQGATLAINGASGGTTMSSPAGGFETADPVGNTSATIGISTGLIVDYTSGTTVLASMVFDSGSDPYISGPIGTGGTNDATVDASTVCE